MKYEIENIDIVKQIGSGSFSKVYLCKKNCIDNDAETSQQLIFITDDVREVHYIIKEININVLVKRYREINVPKIVQSKKNDSPFNPNITPYSRKEYTIPIDNSENEYYYNRLRDLIESEVDIMKIINHKNIVKFYNSNDKDGIYYLCMEYCNDGDVYNLLKTSSCISRNILGGFTNGFVYNFIKQIIEGFVYIHEKHIIHRDIKLQNILLKTTNNVHTCFKISDFGFACFDLTAVEKSEDSLCKKYFKLCGTPYYMAPELILNMNLLENFTKYQSEKNETNVLFYNTKVDIWSFGICIYELITNSLPFPIVKSIKDLDCFFRRNPQEYIDRKIDMNKVIEPILKRLLKMILKINPLERLSAREVKDYIYRYQTPVMNVSSEKIHEDLIEAANIELYGDNLKQHIVSSPIDSNLESESWEKINRLSSVLLNMSVEEGFLDWLKRKK
jgi:serine/threonine protein kinase